MKDSGIEWIGKIPADWKVERLKFHATLSPATPLSEYDDCDEVSFIPMDHLKAGYHKTVSVPYKKVKSGYVVFAEGDILMAKVTPCLENGNLAIASGLQDQVGFGSTEINVLRCKDYNPRYLFFLLQCPSLIEKAKSNMFGVAGLKRLSPDFLPNTMFPVPSNVEQAAIVDYLEKKCAEIDSLIAAKERTNVLLAERCQSMIYETVTKGLVPNVPMKDSGVEWIGEIPSSWSITSLKRIGSPSTGSTPSKANAAYWDGNIPWFSSKDLKSDFLYDSEDHISQEAVDQCGLTLLPENSIIFCVRSGILRHTFPVAITRVPATINQDLRAMTLNESVYPEYLLYYLKGINDVIIAQYQKVGATVESIEMEWFNYLPVIIPNMESQVSIAAYLKKACADIEETIKANTHAIEQLKEYRQSVIYEAVTGKRTLL